MSTVKISAATAVNTLSDSYALPIGNVGNSEANKVTVATLAQYAAKYCSGLMVLMANSDKYPRCCELSYWLSTYSTGTSYQPIGLVVASGTKKIVMALTEPDAGTMYWSSSQGLYNTAITKWKTAMEDFDGEGNTANIALTESDYAVGYCYTYSAAGDGGYGIAAGSWYLPAVGELQLILSRYTAINWALTAIGNAGWTTTLLPRAAYWSSSECSSTHAWFVAFSTGAVNYNAKVSTLFRVRPCAALQELVTV